MNPGHPDTLAPAVGDEDGAPLRPQLIAALESQEEKALDEEPSGERRVLQTSF